jgi:hypothetical protein
MAGAARVLGVLSVHMTGMHAESFSIEAVHDLQPLKEFNMTSITHENHDQTTGGRRRIDADARRVSTETKASFKTTEMVAYVVVAIAVLIAAAVADKGSDFGAQEAWKYVTFLTIGYMVSRGLAKSGSRNFYDDSADSSRDGR